MTAMLVFSTVSKKASARKIAADLLQKRLCACVSISSPMESHYWWKGKKEVAREVLMTLKTSKKALPLLLKRLKQIHPYETPEILVVKADFAHPDYLRWIQRETNS